MKNLRELDPYRVPNPLDPNEECPPETNGAFLLIGPKGVILRVIASSGGGWDHVSVSTEMRIPYWIEMVHVKNLFFKDDECVMQLHVPISEHINCHPHVLHLWRPHHGLIPMPPRGFV